MIKFITFISAYFGSEECKVSENYKMKTCLGPNKKNMFVSAFSGRLMIWNRVGRSAFNFAIIDQCLYIHTHLWYWKNPTAILVFALLILIIVSLNNGRQSFSVDTVWVSKYFEAVSLVFCFFFWIDSILIYYLLTNLTSSSGEFQICFVRRCVFF